jgi:hypothetical protein
VVMAAVPHFTMVAAGAMVRTHRECGRDRERKSKSHALGET